MSASDEEGSFPESGGHVGYGRPPEATRFRKGISGNPRGRPRGSSNLTTILKKVLRERVTINENGQRRTVTKLEAALKQLLNKAAAGDLKAIRQSSELAHELEEKQRSVASQVSTVGVGDVDEEVMQGIVRRFEERDKRIPQQEEAQDELNEQNQQG